MDPSAQTRNDGFDNKQNWFSATTGQMAILKLVSPNEMTVQSDIRQPAINHLTVFKTQPKVSIWESCGCAYWSFNNCWSVKASNPQTVKQHWFRVKVWCLTINAEKEQISINRREE